MTHVCVRNWNRMNHRSTHLWTPHCTRVCKQHLSNCCLGVLSFFVSQTLLPIRNGSVLVPASPLLLWENCTIFSLILSRSDESPFLQVLSSGVYLSISFSSVLGHSPPYGADVWWRPVCVSVSGTSQKNRNQKNCFTVMAKDLNGNISEMNTQ